LTELAVSLDLAHWSGKYFDL